MVVEQVTGRRAAVLALGAALAVAGLAGCGGTGDRSVAAAADPARRPVPAVDAAPAPTTAARPTPAGPVPTTPPPTTTPRTSTTTTTTTTTSTTSTTTSVALPQPIAPPLDEHAGEPLVEVGSLAIPAIGVATTMFEGIRLSTLDHGPGHWPGTALPGQAGNVVVAGHRTTWPAQFRHLDRLVAGDEIVFDGPGGRFVYRVTRTEIVGPDALWIIDQTPTATATLFACHPPGSTRERIVVFAELAA